MISPAFFRIGDTKSGFTLIELLIVISIITILAVVGAVIFSGVQTRARDTARIIFMREVKSALYIYSAVNGKFPVTGTGGDVGTEPSYPNCSNFPDWPQGGFGGLINLLGGQGYLRGPMIDSGKDISCNQWQGGPASWGDLGTGATLGGAPACGWNHCYIFGSDFQAPWPAGYHYWSDGQNYKLILIKEDGSRYVL